MKHIIFFIILIVSFYGQAVAGEVSDIRYYSDPSKPIEVAAGQKFIIALESNRTTGYQWQLAAEPDRAVVQLESVEYRVSNTGLVGAGGTEMWQFKSLSPGQTTIAL
jgi:inhibitor of cysteine peptidase